MLEGLLPTVTYKFLYKTGVDRNESTTGYELSLRAALMKHPIIERARKDSSYSIA